jgi:hypothetical protein
MTALSEWIDANQVAVWHVIQNDPTWLFLKHTMNNVSELSWLVNDMGWETVQEAAEAVAPLNQWAQYITPPVSMPVGSIGIDRASLPTTSYTQVYGDIFHETGGTPNSQTVLANNVALTWGDLSYGLLTKEQIDFIAAASPSAAHVFVPETMDCDDFSDIMNGWLAENGLGNAAVGIAIFNVYEGSQLVGAHANLVAVDTNHQAWWIEPQNGQVYDIQDIYVRADADRIVVTDLFF